MGEVADQPHVVRSGETERARPLGEVLIVLAATLPRQIEMTKDMYSLASGWNDMVAIWARLGGVVDNMRPDADTGYDNPALKPAARRR